jgi:hypothetical protein
MKLSPRLACYASLLLALALGATGCKSNAVSADSAQPANTDPTQAQSSDPSQAQSTDQSQDPASANVVPISNATTGTASSTGTSGGQTGSNQAPSGQYDSNQYNQDNGYGQTPEEYAPQPPPALPEYQQPSSPGDGYMWTPGYWDYNNEGYYWVPGAWVSAPYEGALWTPGYWGFRGGRYAHYRGYWGRHVGYYGGINYGFGYIGFGYQGGYWRGNQFDYNRSVNNIDISVVRNYYSYRVTNTSVTRVSYNGGSGGVSYRPRAAEIAAIREEHNPPMAAQMELRQSAQVNRQNFASVNHGRPAIVVSARPLPADRGVRAPAVVHYAAAQPMQRPGQPQMNERPNQPQRATEPNRQAEPNRAAPGRSAPEPRQPNRSEAVQRQQPERNAHPAPQQRAQPERTNPGRPQAQHAAPSRPAQQQRAVAPHESRPAPQQRPQAEKKPEQRRPQ